MGDLSTALVILITSFLLGILSMHWTVDHLILWQSPITKENIISAHIYYLNTLIKMSKKFQLIWYLISSSEILILILKVLNGKESNWLFDGASLFLFGSIIVIHFQKILPNLKNLPFESNLIESNLYKNFSNNNYSKNSLFLNLREIASSNAVQAAALVGILILQSGQYYSERLEKREIIEEFEAKLRRRKRRLERQNQQFQSRQSSGSNEIK